MVICSKPLLAEAAALEDDLIRFFFLLGNLIRYCPRELECTASDDELYDDQLSESDEFRGACGY